MRKKGEKIPATVRADRSREVTKASMARELCMAVILGRLWPSYVTPWDNKVFRHLLCIQSPAGLLVWRLDDEEIAMFEHLQRQPRATEKPTDRLPVLQALAADWLG